MQAVKKWLKCCGESLPYLNNEWISTLFTSKEAILNAGSCYRLTFYNSYGFL